MTERPATAPGSNVFLTMALLAVVVYVAHYLNLLHFGLYEDDYYYIGPNSNWANVLVELKAAMLTWPQGRPIGFALPPLLAFAGASAGGLPAIYLIGFLIISLNTGLFYALLRRVGTETLAVGGALAYCLYPADTTHILLTHAFQLQTALTFWLIGAHLYLSGRGLLAYVAAAASLLTYETPFLVFLALPLLGRSTGRALLREGFRNTVILAGITALVVLVRLKLGEERLGGISQQDLPEIAVNIAKSMVMGPIVSLQQLAFAPLRAQLYWSFQLTLICAVPLAAMLWLWRRADRDAVPDAPASRLPTARLYLAGGVMLGLAYLLSFTHYPPVEIFGRGTSVHLASALGGSLVFGCLCSQVLAFAKRFRLGGVAMVGLSLYLALIVGYRLLIQADFARAWQNQREFWTSAIELLPDITDDTVIFLVDRDLPQTTFILAHSWADPVVLRQVFAFPSHWLNPPRLFVVPEDWSRGLAIVDLGSSSGLGKHLEWMVPEATWESHLEVLPDSNLVLLEMEGGKLVRRQGSLNIGGVQFRLRPVASGGKPDFPRGPLFDLLIGEGK